MDQEEESPEIRGDLRLLDAGQAHALEPALHCTAALLSPSTGIVDSHGLMLALLGDAAAQGAMLADYQPVLAELAAALHREWTKRAARES